ncbi:thylakoid lumenal 15 kDa protein 1, chloroplastic isoform X1 [Olea europaea var. sylvestris]|uniref:thylakoid lumenal 15 kDa protein 1, chloroplastic isoform X1 n=1 Tax=Olea europaea var. sylvestris TaxID=158386 RepID=UPI000C1D3208|nr:thylakoid lumenal 15 kDa protein 1, chloroplastic isoform X1 [Olea europaea var. sylvestris]
MAILNLCLCSKFSTNPNPKTISFNNSASPSKPIISSLSLSSPRAPQGPQIQNHLSSLCESISKASVLVVLSASIVFASNPALAFKGGGPYGAEVTRGQDLTGKDFSGKALIKQDFKTSILRQANFKGAKLLGASFFDADLTGADLSDADLRGADFSLANVTKANLSNANLEGALATGNTSFKGAIITGADFTDVPLRDDQREYLCKFANGMNPVTGNETRETLLCN